MCHEDKTIKYKGPLINTNTVVNGRFRRNGEARVIGGEKRSPTDTINLGPGDGANKAEVGVHEIDVVSYGKPTGSKF